MSGRATSFLRSEQGRKILAFTTTGFAGAIFAGYVYINTWGIDRSRAVIQLYQQGVPRPVHPDVMSRAQKIAEDLKIRMKQRSIINFFSVYGFEPKAVGSLKTTLGAWIGIPYNFSYKSHLDIDRSNIVIDNKPVSWSSEDGLNLQEALVFSPNAQNFVIAREVANVNTYYVYIFGGVHAGGLILYQVLSILGNELFLGFARPKSFRLFLYSMAGLFSWGVWAATKDIITRYYENAADKTAMSLGYDFATGAVEYYGKCLQRNIALRGLMGKGELLFTPYGNVNEFVRQKHIPISVRKQRAEEFAQKFKSGEISDKSNSVGITDKEELLN